MTNRPIKKKQLQYEVRVLDQISDDGECCCDPEYSLSDVCGIVAALNQGAIGPEAFCFYPREQYSYADPRLPVIYKRPGRSPAFTGLE